MSRTGQIVSRFPSFYRSDDTENLYYKFIGVFASMLDDAEEDLLRVMKTHWVNTADNEGSKGFDATEKGDLDKILALYLESLGGTALLKQGTRRTGDDGKLDDALYRTRILGLIQVLKNGASTKSGIIDIVAANLGIVSDLPYATVAHDSIRIIEFLPQPGNAIPPVPVALFTDIPVENVGPLPAAAEFRLVFKPDLPLPLVNPRVTNPTTGESIQYTGTVTPGDSLFFLSDGTGLFRGQPFQPVGSLLLQAGDSNLRVEASVGVPRGVFDTDFFDFSQFDDSTLRSIGLFDNATFDNSIFGFVQTVGTMEVRYNLLSPGSFMVVIPWDIPGFSVNISITDHTLERLVAFGVDQAMIDALSASSFINKEFETREDLFAAMGPVVADFTPVQLSRNIINQLSFFGVSGTLVTKSIALLDTDSGVANFNQVQGYFDAIGVTSDAEKKTLYSALGLLAAPSSSLALVLREGLFTDKYARFNISPRGQIKAIVDRVKAAGVYAVIAFEKRFWEDQQLGEQFGITLRRTPEDQEMTEANFDLLSAQSESEVQNMSDFFSTGGVFEYTRFDSLNTFA
jgi:hypothetical protein